MEGLDAPASDHTLAPALLSIVGASSPMHNSIAYWLLETIDNILIFYIKVRIMLICDSILHVGISKPKCTHVRMPVCIFVGMQVCY